MAKPPRPTDDDRRQLDEEGYVILRGFIPETFRRELLEETERLFDAEGDMAGAEFKQETGCRRLANMVNKGEIFQRVVADSVVLSLVQQVLGNDFKLSSLNVRSTNPHSDVTQPLHADMGAVADEFGFWVCNSIWMLTDVTEKNGPVRLIPGSHHQNRLPQDVLDDPVAPHPREIYVTGIAGAVVIMNAHLWHGGLPNRTDHPRTVLHGFYCRGDKPQQQYQRQLLSPTVQAALSPRLRRLLAIDSEQNDVVSADPVVRSGFLR